MSVWFIHMWGCMCPCIHVTSPGSTSISDGCLLHCSLSCLLRQGLSLNMDGAHQSARPLAGPASGSLLSLTTSFEITGVRCCAPLVHGCWAPKLRACACTANIPPSEPSPQPCNSLLIAVLAAVEQTLESYLEFYLRTCMDLAAA